MKKFTLIIIALTFSISFLHAQSYTLSWEGEIYGDTVVIFGEPDDPNLDFHGILTNNSSDSDTIKIHRRFINMLPDAVHTFCWGQCYTPNPDSLFSPNGYVIVEPGQTSGESDFVAHYIPNNEVGISMVEYTFYNKNDEDESLTIVAVFNTYPDGIDEDIFNNINVSKIYPNPATNFVNMDYELPGEVKTANVKIVNLLGSVVMEQQVEVNNNNMRMNISDLDGGIYFYSLFVNGEMFSTNKLIVR